MKTRVLIVEDSVSMSALLTEIISMDSDLEVVGVAADPYEAREKIKLLKPDVLTLDVEMPRMDGITFLKNLMKLRPMPVVMLSSLTEKNSMVTLEAIEIGAIDYIAKPNGKNESLIDSSHMICEKVKAAAKVDVRFFNPEEHTPKNNVELLRKYRIKPNLIVAIGASTGGTEAIKEVLLQLPSNSAPIVITQHIPASFSKSYTKRLDKKCRLNVVEAIDGMKINQGYAYLAPGDKHLGFKRINGELICKLIDSAPVNRHKPSVEVMFNSLRELDDTEILSVMLTGMGQDGSLAMKRLAEDGHSCLLQDEKTSVVWGMPKAAYELGVTDKLTALNDMPQEILRNMIDIPC